MNTSFCIRRLVAATFSAVLALTSVAAKAEDIDIFTGTPPDGAKPNVLIVIDNSSNWNSTLSANACNTGNMADDTMFAAEICALTTVVAGLNDKIRVGLMLFAETGSNGGYVRFGIRDMNDTNKKALNKQLLALNRSNGSGDATGSNQPLSWMMFEAFKYFGGYSDPPNATKDQQPTTPSPVNSSTAFGLESARGGPANSAGTTKRDYLKNPINGSAWKAGAEDLGAVFADKDATKYISPITKDTACAKNFIVFIANGDPGTGGDSGISTILSNIHVTRTSIPTSATEIHAQKFDEMAEFLYQTDVSDQPGQQRVRTYTVAVYKPKTIEYADAKETIVKSETLFNADQSMVNLMKSAANVGGGKYFAARRASDVVDALFDILNEVQAVNSVFVSASLPVSVNNQGTFLNQVYMGMFRPDGGGNPRWMGNLKEYKFKLDATSGAISLADSANNEAVNTATGFISPKAVSFWTRGGTDPAGTGWPAKDFWVNNKGGTPVSGSDTPDGEVVEKGGAGEMLRMDFAKSQDSRAVYTCLDTGCGSNGVAPDKFNSTTVTGSSYISYFGAADATELKLLVNWIRGQDNKTCDPSDTTNCTTAVWAGGAELGPGLPATVRASIHGDVLHSRPVVINYPGDPAKCNTCGPWVFYGANDGMLRATRGGQDGTLTAKDGHEAWAFVAPEFYGRYRRLRETKPELKTAAALPGTTPKDYFFDGPIGVWEEPYEVDPSDKTKTIPAVPKKWIFPTARRGGAIIYAFDVTDPTKPLFMWKKTVKELPNLGQTWSTPWAFLMDGVTDPILMFGAGYDTDEDLTSPVGTGTVGRGIYVLNAATGKELDGGIVKTGFIQTDGSAKITFPVPADMSLLVGSNPDGIVQVYRAYVGDTGGNLWRLDMPSGKLDSWHMYKFAELGAVKFFYAPDVVHAGAWDVVLAGTGDREKPLVKTSQDYFFAINDTNAAAGVPATAWTALKTTNLVELKGTSGITTALGGTCTGATCVCDAVAGCKGWYRTLSTGEKVVNSPLTVAGITYFSTNKPKASTGTCDVNLGEARAYGLSFYGGEPNKTQPDGTIGTPLTGGGLPPSPVGGVVEIEPGKQVAFIIGGGDKGSPVEGGRISIPVSSTRRKLYWNSATDK